MLGFGRKNNLAAFDAAVRSAKALYELQRQETNAQLTRLNYEFEGLNVDIFELRKLVKHNTEIIGLYLEQLNSGTISLTDGIGLYSEAAETQIALLDAESDLVLNCLRSSQIRGLLAVRGET
jgi:outer membrane protein TolC